MSVAITIDAFDMSSIENALQRIERIKERLRKDTDTAMAYLADEAYDAAYNTAHRCTGDLRNNLRVEGRDGTYYLISDVEAVTADPALHCYPIRALEVRDHVHYAAIHEDFLKSTEGVGYMEAASITARMELPAVKAAMSFYD